MLISQGFEKVKNEKKMEVAKTIQRHPMKTTFAVMLLLWTIRHDNSDNTVSSNIISSMLDKPNSEYIRAFHDSGGFFDDIKTDHWELMRRRVDDAEYVCTNRCVERKGNQNGLNTRWFALLFDWEPIFTCPFERRIGGLGDGSKWVCDPHRIHDQVEKKGCLVYSVGSFGDFTFENSIHQDISSKCEIHTMDPEISGSFKKKAPNHVTFHSWGFRAKDQNAVLKEGNRVCNFKTFDETVSALGHAGRTIDIFKIDCEGCEWKTYEDWIKSNVDIRQILIVRDIKNCFFF